MRSQVLNYFRIIIYLSIFLSVVYPKEGKDLSYVSFAVDINRSFDTATQTWDKTYGILRKCGIDDKISKKIASPIAVLDGINDYIQQLEEEKKQRGLREVKVLWIHFLVEKDPKGASKAYAILQKLQREVRSLNQTDDYDFLDYLSIGEFLVSVENVGAGTEEYAQCREPSVLNTVRNSIANLRKENQEVFQNVFVTRLLDKYENWLNKLEAEDLKRQATFNNAMAIVEEKLENKILDENDLEIMQKNMEIARDTMRTKAERAKFERAEGAFLISKNFYNKNNIERSPGERVVLTLGNIEFAFRWAPPGTFLMGSPEDEIGRRDDEQLHKVKITRGFWMLEGEITQEMYELCFPGTTATKPWFRINNKKLIDYATSEGGKTIDKLSTIKHNKVPMENVDWGEAVEYCNIFNDRFNPKKRGSFKLPTEAQWEMACRAGETGAFSIERKNIIVKQLNTGLNYTHYKRPNAWGLYDMPGSVAEWTSDWYRKYPEYKNETAVDPKGPESPIIVERVSRGGCWWNATTKDCRSAARYPARAEGVADTGSGYHPGTFGFRIIFDPYDESEAPSESPGVMEDGVKEMKNTGNGLF